MRIRILPGGNNCLPNAYTLLNISNQVIYLLTVSTIWSVSFGLFKTCLVSIDPSLTAFLRLFIAFIVFIPLLKISKLPAKARLAYFAIGAVEYGLMYLFLNRSFQYLDGWQVALMTLFTPFYIVIIDGIRKKKIDVIFLMAAAIAVAGAAIAICGKDCALPDSIKGIVFVQLSDISFAAGQLFYRRVRKSHPEVSDAKLYALLFAGGVTIALCMTLFSGSLGGITQISGNQWAALLYMGLISSALCFFLWNVGATKVSTGILAVMSNIKVPMAVAVSLIFFKECAGSWVRLLLGAAVMALAVYLAHKRADRIA
jgi:drug/metabolite transporter (DMT)-like permease